jgi:transmembrane sensor
MTYSRKDIEDFFKGRLSKKEAENFLKWMDTPEGEAEYGSIIDQIWGDETGDELGDLGIKPKIERLNTQSVFHNKVSNKERNKDLRGIWLGIAASLLLVFSVSYIFYFNQPVKNETEDFEVEELIVITKLTPRGNKKIITLPDGSTVVLNSDSKLTYGSDFNRNRIINLEGEGFFEVKKDEAHPFIVITGKISTTALGTSFNVRAYGESNDIQVSLASGKVRVQNTEDENLIEIIPGEAVDFSNQQQTLQKKQIDISKVLNWKEGILHFDKVPFQQVILELERWYDVEISLSGTNKVPEYKCTGTFKKHEYLSNVLKALSYSLDFKYEISGNHVELKFK